MNTALKFRTGFDKTRVGEWGKMDIHEQWEKALKHTEIVRMRLQPLSSVADTRLPYTFLSESLKDNRHTCVRKGEVVVERPTLILPPNIPQWEGFEFEKQKELDPGQFMNFLLVRGVRFPSLKYNNITYSLSLYEGGLEAAVRFYTDQFQKQENITTGLLLGPEDCWQFSILIMIGAQVLKSADGDIRRLLERPSQEGP